MIFVSNTNNDKNNKNNNNEDDEQQIEEEGNQFEQDELMDLNITLVLYHIAIVHCCRSQSSQMTTLSYQIFSDYQNMIENSNEKKKNSHKHQQQQQQQQNNKNDELVKTLKEKVSELLGIQPQMVNWPGLNRMVGGGYHHQERLNGGSLLGTN